MAACPVQCAQGTCAEQPEAAQANQEGRTTGPAVRADVSGNAGDLLAGLGSASGSREVLPRARSDGPTQWLLEMLCGRKVGETVQFPRVLKVLDHTFTSAFVERDFRTASGAHLLRMYPGGKHFIVKFADVRQEYAMMCALLEMNRRWHEHCVYVCGQPVQTLTYGIVPIGESGGLIEAVSGCRTLRELRRVCRSDPRERVYEALVGDANKLDTLAATTTAYLTACYSLGVRDGHDDNIMLREDGSLFRVDFGFVFGATPEIDTPQTVVARAVTYALGERWLEVVAACGDSLTALTGNSYGSPPALDCLSSVPELEHYLPLARVHTASLSLAGFCQDVSCADQWSFSRAAKNTLREAVQFLRDQTGLGPDLPDDESDKAEAELPQTPGTEPAVDPFTDLNFVLDSGVDLLGLYRAMPEYFACEPEQDLTNWFMTGPVADFVSMAKEGLVKDSHGSGMDSPTIGRYNASMGQMRYGLHPKPGAEMQSSSQDWVASKSISRDILLKLAGSIPQHVRKPALPFPVNVQSAHGHPTMEHHMWGCNQMQQSPGPVDTSNGLSSQHQLARGEEWPSAKTALPVQPLPANDPFARTPDTSPRELSPQLLEVLGPKLQARVLRSFRCPSQPLDYATTGYGATRHGTSACTEEQQLGSTGIRPLSAMSRHELRGSLACTTEGSPCQGSCVGRLESDCFRAVSLKPDGCQS
ncbi:unnamed protein product [Effrenium voratum]|uniref:PI3K/PI4K catalytic domain-containing protein n=1 Tax=Effrenium voratum TaxID=2562239 RepID=A0AA36HU60_9DINO|nr:unnamed protein product [Effrenium voratum]CAJ1448325.1 unnamed protein product [Effrenium voratum]